MVAPVPTVSGTAARRLSWTRRLRRLLLGALVSAAAVYGLVAVYAAEKFTHPLRQAVPPCSVYGLTCTDVQFPSATDAIPLRGWAIHGGAKATILLLHGRDGRRDDPSLGLMDIAHGLLDQGYNVFTFDFRAHGLSGGDRYSIGDWERRDVAGALAYLQGQGVPQIGAMGFSMGAGTLLRTTPDHPELRAVVLDSPFAELRPIIERRFTGVSGLPLIFVPGVLLAAQDIFGMNVDDNKPEQEMARLGDRPVFLIHAGGDTYIPVSQAYTLQRIGAADPHFQSWIAAGSEHVRMFKDHRAEYMQRVLTFFGTYLP